MRIPSAYIPIQARKLPPVSLPAGHLSAGQRQVQAATESYNKNAKSSTSKIIDAEYVELYTPGSEVLNQERHNLDYTLEAEAPSGAAIPKPGNPLAEAVGKYRHSAKKAPEPPGTLLSVYA